MREFYTVRKNTISMKTEYKVKSHSVRGVVRWYVVRVETSPFEGLSKSYLWRDGTWQGHSGLEKPVEWYDAPGFYRTEQEAWDTLVWALGETISDMGFMDFSHYEYRVEHFRPHKGLLLWKVRRFSMYWFSFDASRERRLVVRDHAYLWKDDLRWYKNPHSNSFLTYAQQPGYFATQEEAERCLYEAVMAEEVS